MTPVDPNERHAHQNPGSPSHGTDRCRLLIGPLSDLMTDLDKVRYGGRQSPDGANGPFAMWQDDRNLYVEVDLPGNCLTNNIDISIFNNKVWVRIGIRNDEADVPVDG